MDFTLAAKCPDERRARNGYSLRGLVQDQELNYEATLPALQPAECVQLALGYDEELADGSQTKVPDCRNPKTFCPRSIGKIADIGYSGHGSGILMIYNNRTSASGVWF